MLQAIADTFGIRQYEQETDVQLTPELIRKFQDMLFSVGLLTTRRHAAGHVVESKCFYFFQ